MSVDLSPQCRNSRHGACPRDAGGCLCECHDELPKIVTHWGDPDPAVTSYPCRVASCGHEAFSTEIGERVHYARVHGPNATNAPAADMIRSPVPLTLRPEPAQARWVLVARVVAFLTGVDNGAAMDAAMDEWAVWKMENDPDIARMVEILEQRKSG